MHAYRGRSHNTIYYYYYYYYLNIDAAAEPKRCRCLMAAYGIWGGGGGRIYSGVSGILVVAEPNTITAVDDYT